MRQACVTVVYGSHAERLDRTFTSFAQNSFLELHAFVLGESLPNRRFPGITYHLRPTEPAWSHPMRDADFRRWVLIDELGVDYALVVDGCDVLCMQPIPELPELLRGGWLAAVCEHPNGRYIEGIYVGSFVNAGVTFWDVRASKPLRDQVVARGRVRFRNYVDDQLCLNELVFARYLDRLTLLPCTYNYRAFLGRRVSGWPSTDSLDGVRIYHHDEIERAKTQLPVRPNPPLVPLVPDSGPVGRQVQFLRRLRQRLKPHIVTGTPWEGLRARWFR